MVIIGLVLLASKFLIGREYPPEAPPPKPVTLPTPAVKVLSNGLKVIVIERHSLPVITLRRTTVALASLVLVGGGSAGAVLTFASGASAAVQATLYAAPTGTGTDRASRAPGRAVVPPGRGHRPRP